MILKTWEENKIMFSVYFRMAGAKDFIASHPNEAGINIDEFARLLRIR